MQLLKTMAFCGLSLSAALFAPAHAGLIKWINNEALPTLSGRKPVVIKPYVSIKSKNIFMMQVGPDSGMIKVGDVTVKTSQLAKRLAQAGCIAATSGNVLACAPDVIEKNARDLFNDTLQGIGTDLINNPGTGNPHTTPTSPPASPGGLIFTDLNGKEIPWGPPAGPAVGFDFNNPGTPAGTQQPSAFQRDFVFSRSVVGGKAQINIDGRVDFAFMNGRSGGVLCFFASEKGAYLYDHNGQYVDPYGLVAVGSSVTVQGDMPEIVAVQLAMPWSELELPAGTDPHSPKFVKCSTVVEGKPLQETEWVPF
ncbi:MULTISPECIES: hypothetical protein [unclassified Variovorax]|uniref:hypothetical protein n=1 Tax=unclassified Variovorax TaxID=663243 RepID=UPI003F4800FF